MGTPAQDARLRKGSVAKSPGKAKAKVQPWLDPKSAAGGAKIVGKRVADAAGSAAKAVGAEVGRDVDAAKRAWRGAKELLNVDEIVGGGR